MDGNTGRIPRIVVGVDDSRYAQCAADWAAQLAADLGARVIVAHALDLRASAVFGADPTRYTERSAHAGEQLLARTVARITALHPGLRVTPELSDLDPARALAGLAAGADLLVTGTRGHGGFTGGMLGSVSGKLAAQAPCPMVVIGTRPPPEPRAELVLGVGHKQENPPIDFAFASAARLGLSVRVVRAFEPWITYGDSFEQAVPGLLEEVEDLLAPARCDHPGVAVSVEVSPRVPVSALVEAGTGARLIVVGSSRRGTPAFGPGHIVHGLLAHAVTPVAVVPIP
jgi:nucleotide-binding universal stress UspA family protein